MAFQFGEYRSLNRNEKPCLEGAKLGGDLKKYFLQKNHFLAVRHNSKSFIRCIMDKITIGCIGNGSCSSEALAPPDPYILADISSRGSKTSEEQDPFPIQSGLILSMMHLIKDFELCLTAKT